MFVCAGFALIIGTETWLHPTIQNSNFFMTRSRTQSTAKIATEKGGGVLIGVREEIKSAALPELDACCEILWVKIFTRGNKHAHICAY